MRQMHWYNEFVSCAYIVEMSNVGNDEPLVIVAKPEVVDAIAERLFESHHWSVFGMDVQQIAYQVRNGNCRIMGATVKVVQ